MKRRRNEVGWLVMATVFAVSGCTAPPVEPDLSSDQAAAKVPALVAESERGERADFVALVRALDDDDPAVRFAASQSLAALTGQDLGYRFFDSRLDRQDALSRWQDWLIDRQTALPGDAAGQGRSAQLPALSPETLP